jgi:hypothetical protein
MNPPGIDGVRMLPTACGPGPGLRLLEGVTREPFEEPHPLWYRLMMDVAVLACVASWRLATPVSWWFTRRRYRR